MLTIRHTLGARPHGEAGTPLVTASGHGMTVVGGELGRLQWHGDGTRDSHWRAHTIGVFTPDGRCTHLRRSSWRTRAVVVHPSLPLAVVGTGGYDGGYSFEGELLVLDLVTGTAVDLLERPLEVRELRWLDERRLECVFAPPNDDEYKKAFTHGYREVLELPDWTSPAGHAYWPEFAKRVKSAHDLPEAARSGRGRVWSVHGLPDGSLLACTDTALLEAWADGGLVWSVPDGLGGRQLVPAPGGGSVWVNAPGPRADGESGWDPAPGRVSEHSITDGARLATLDLPFEGVLTSRADGWLAVRESHWDTRKPAVALRSPGGELHQAKVGRYDLFNHWFPVQGAPELWFLKGKPETKRLVTLDPVSGELTTRFPLEWDPGRGAQLFGGPALHLGDALVHAGTVYDGRGLLPGNAFVVRRALPDGRAEWVHTADRPVTALAGDGETVYAAFNSGELLALDARDGSVRWRHDLDPGVALSLHLPSPDRLVLGLVDGRILDCSV